MQSRHRVSAVREHGTLVDRAFVRDFAAIDGGRFRQQTQPRDAVGASGGTARQLVLQLLEKSQHGRAAEHIGQGGVSR